MSAPIATPTATHHHHKTRLRASLDAQALEAVFAAFDRDGYSHTLNTPAPWRARERAWSALYRAGTIARSRRNGVLAWVLVA